MLRAYKYRMYPTKSQACLIDKHLNCCRFIYNLALETRDSVYKSTGVCLSKYDLHKQLTELKIDCEWLSEVDSQCLQQSINDLDNAFSLFIKGVTKFPKFKKKYSRQSYRSANGLSVKVDFDNGTLKLPKINTKINVVFERRFVGKIRNATISKELSGKYFVSILVDTNFSIPEAVPVLPENSIGIDLGIKSFLVTSEGYFIHNPKFLKNSEKRLKCLSRRLSRKKRGSKNRRKAKQKLLLLHEKVANQRKDFLHKTSTDIINKHDTICFEDLNITGMKKNHCVAKAISDVGWGAFIRYCRYKALWEGKNILNIGQFEPSSKTCSNCGNIKQDLNLSEREWECLKCHTVLDRDLNAAINIKVFALNNSGRVSPSEIVELSAIAEAMKQ